MPSAEDPLWMFYPIINRCFSKNGKISILRNESIGLIKGWKAGLKNLLISPSTKRGIGERVMRDDRRGEWSNPSCSLHVAPTYLQCELTLNLDDYGEKACWRYLLLNTETVDGLNVKRRRCSLLRLYHLAESSWNSTFRCYRPNPGMYRYISQRFYQRY